jgi:hypothetical protein
MSIPSFIKLQTERRTHSIYSRLEPRLGPQSLGELFEDSELPLCLKFSAVFAAFASFELPLQLSAFRSLIPDCVWNEHFRFRDIGMRTGFWPIFSAENEWEYELRIGPQSRYGPHIILIATNSAICGEEAEIFAAPVDSSVVRFTLCHPFLQPELHDPSGIYLFKNA